MKRIVAMFLAVVMLFTSGGEVLAAQVAEGNPDVRISVDSDGRLTGYVEGEGIGITLEEGDADKLVTAESSTKYSTVYDHDWDKYSTNYYYNQLSEDEKELWDKLDEVCRYYLEKKDTIKASLAEYGYWEPTLDAVPVSFDMTTDELKVFWQLFMFSNPQYYFLLNRYYFYKTESGMIQSVLLTCYDAFADGDDRAAATKKVKKQVNKWEDILEDYDSDAEKLKKIHDLICEKVTYNYDIFADYWISAAEEAQWFSQTAYSVFCMDTTVCAGYADAMAMMCNGIGLDAVSVTSPDHQWNKIRLNDVWYNYDLTWADSNDSYVDYRWFARSDEQYQKDGYSHTEETFWADYSPKAKTDVEPSDPWKEPGKYPKLSKAVATPMIQVTRSDSGYTVKFICDTKNAKLYYTLDGNDPDVASSKSIKYKKEFKLKKACTVKVIAIRDGYKDSKIASLKISKKATSLEKAKIKLSKTKYTYDGEKKKPTVKVTVGKKELKENQDYTVSYKNNKNIGKATVTITGINNYAGKVKTTFTISAKVGTTFKSGNNKYKVTSSSEVSFVGLKDKSKSKVTIPKTVKYGGKSFKVTAIADKALKSNKKVTSITIGANVKSIGKEAFYKCGKLKTITISSTKLEKVGKNALKGIHSKAKIKVPEKKLKDYKTILKKKGQGSKVQIVKNK